MDPRLHKVSIVVEPDYGSRLEELSQHAHVWACNTPANRAAAKAIWDMSRIYDLESGVTIFDFASDCSAADVVRSVLNDVDIHHGEYSHDPPWSIIEVIGCSPTESLAASFEEFGAECAVIGPNHFEARRKLK